MKIIKIVTALLVSIAILITLIVFYSNHELNKEDPNYIKDFINEQPHKTTLVVKKNDEIIYNHNGDKDFYTASLFKLVVVIEAYKQANEGKINLEKVVSLKDIDKYSLLLASNTGHNQWKKTLNSEKVTINNVLKGILTHSSNPNTDYIIDLVGESNINNTKNELLGSKHSDISTINSFLGIPIYLMKNKGYSIKQVDNLIDKSDGKNYKNLLNQSDRFLNNNHQRKDIRYFYPDDDIQKVWSKLTPKGRALDYIRIRDKAKSLYGINDDDFLNTLNKEKNDKYYFEKSGETLNIFNKYTVIKNKNDEYEIIFMSNELDDFEKSKLKNNIDGFISNIIKEKYQLGEK